jgi:hypothetical protein
MNPYFSKDYLDTFYSKPIDEHYERLKFNSCQGRNKTEKKTFRIAAADYTSDSTSAEEDCLKVKNRKKLSRSIFNCNLFEKTQKTLKIKEALANGWRENLVSEKKQILVKILKGKGKSAFFLHN